MELTRSQVSAVSGVVAALGGAALLQVVGIREHTLRAFLIVSAIWLVTSVVLSLVVGPRERIARDRSIARKD